MSNRTLPMQLRGEGRPSPALVHRWYLSLLAASAGALRFTLYCLLLCLSSAPAFAGVTAESTRVVFSAGATEQSLQLVNLNQYPVVVQAWVDDGKLAAVPEESTAPIIALPPIFRMNQGDQTSLRLIYSGEPLPQDRESLFWLNLYEIPPKATDLPPEAATLTVSMRTQMKVFVRPEKLPFSADKLSERLIFSLKMHSGTPHLTIANPTPYFATIGALQVVTGGVSQEQAVEMLSPFSRVTLELAPIPPAAVGNAEILFALVNDDGNLVLGKRTVAPE